MAPPSIPAPVIRPVAAPPPPPSGMPPVLMPPQRARANLNSYFAMDDYPARAINTRHEGTAGFRLTIGTSGRVTDCQIVESSGSQALDMATCRILRSRARYIPARGSDGMPASGANSGRVTWRLDDVPADRAGLAMAYVPAVRMNGEVAVVTAVDYPPAGPASAPDHMSELRVAVGREGQVIGCDIETSSGSATLDAAACRLYSARAHFEPGRSATGANVCDVVWVAVDWAPAAAGRTAPSRGMRTPRERRPLPLREQLNATLCPGWRSGNAR